MFKKIIFLFITFILIFNLTAFAEEENNGENQQTGSVPTVTTGEKEDYLTIRNNAQGNESTSINPFNGYYNTPQVNEPFNYKTNDNITTLPENKIDEDGYSGYYTPDSLLPYNYPAPETVEGTTAGSSNAIELNENSFLNGLDIAGGGLPVWKQIQNASVKVDNIKEKNVSIFTIVQPESNNLVGYNIEFVSNREDGLAFKSFILEKSTNNVQLMVQEENNQNFIKTGNFNLIEDGSGKKIMVFSYEEKEITLELWQEGVNNTYGDYTSGQENTESTLNTENTNPVPIFKETEEDNTIMEINF